MLTVVFLLLTAKQASSDPEYVLIQIESGPNFV